MQTAKSNYFIRQAKREDSKRVWQIRNHPAVRVNANNPEAILLEKHQQWFEQKYFKDKNNYCFVLEGKQTNGQNKLIGYCRFDLGKEGNSYIASIALDVDEQGRGLGSFLLSGSLKKIKTAKAILAEVRIGNAPGLKVFKKNSFEVLRQDQEKYYLQYQN